MLTAHGDYTAHPVTVFTHHGMRASNLPPRYTTQFWKWPYWASLGKVTHLHEEKAGLISKAEFRMDREHLITKASVQRRAISSLSSSAAIIPSAPREAPPPPCPWDPHLQTSAQARWTFSSCRSSQQTYQCASSEPCLLWHSRKCSFQTLPVLQINPFRTERAGSFL